ncbi:MAG: putative transposase [Pedosphaera sp.]|nr:putative transposase [Pedosphaera sp.]
MRRISIQLSEAERQTVRDLRTKGAHPARELTRAHILAALDQGASDQQIQKVLGGEPDGVVAHPLGLLGAGLKLRVARRAPPRGTPALPARPTGRGGGFWPAAPPRPAAVDPTLAGGGGPPAAPIADRQPGNDPSVFEKNLLKPWRKAMWCVGRLTAEYRERMAGLCELYTRPHDPNQPVVCVDEKSKQLLATPQGGL